MWVAVLIIAGIVAAFFRWAHKALGKHEREHEALTKIPERLDRIESGVSDVRFQVGVLVMKEQERDSKFLANLERLKTLGHASGYPYDPSRKAYLLDRYGQRTITLDEARELQRYLQQDARGASVGTGLLIILGVLAGLAALIYLLSRNEGGE